MQTLAATMKSPPLTSTRAISSRWRRRRSSAPGWLLVNASVTRSDSCSVFKIPVSGGTGLLVPLVYGFAKRGKNRLFLWFKIPVSGAQACLFLWSTGLRNGDSACIHCYILFMFSPLSVYRSACVQFIFKKWALVQNPGIGGSGLLVPLIYGVAKRGSDVFDCFYSCFSPSFLQNSKLITSKTISRRKFDIA